MDRVRREGGAREERREEEGQTATCKSAMQNTNYGYQEQKLLFSAMPSVDFSGECEAASHAGSRVQESSLLNVSRIRCKLSQPDKI